MAIEKKNLVFEYLRKNGEKTEQDILTDCKISHGTFYAVKNELTNEHLLAITKKGRQMFYSCPDVLPIQTPSDLTQASKPTAVSRSSTPNNEKKTKTEEKKMPIPKNAELCTYERNMPIVAGMFFSFEEWQDEVVAKVGGCVDIDQLDDEIYIVRSDGGDWRKYRIVENTDGTITARYFR